MPVLPNGALQDIHIVLHVLRLVLAVVHGVRRELGDRVEVAEHVTDVRGRNRLASRVGPHQSPDRRAVEVLDKAEEIQAKEAAMAEAVKAGKPVSDVMGGDYENMLVKK